MGFLPVDGTVRYMCYSTYVIQMSTVVEWYCSTVLYYSYIVGQVVHVCHSPGPESRVQIAVPLYWLQIEIRRIRRCDRIVPTGTTLQIDYLVLVVLCHSTCICTSAPIRICPYLVQVLQYNCTGVPGTCSISKCGCTELRVQTFGGD